MPSSIRACATRLGGGLRPPSSSEGASTAPSDASPENRIAPAKPARERQRSRAWYLDVWAQILRRKPLGTVGGGIGVVMLAGGGGGGGSSAVWGVGARVCVGGCAGCA